MKKLNNKTIVLEKSMWGINKNSDANITYVQKWQRQNKKRIYFNDYQNRTLCYIDCNNNNTIVMIEENQIVYKNAIEICNKFMEEYDF